MTRRHAPVTNSVLWHDGASGLAAERAAKPQKQVRKAMSVVVGVSLFLLALLGLDLLTAPKSPTRSR